MADQYYSDIHHTGLGKYERIRGTDPYVVERRAQTKLEQWERQWSRAQEASQKQAEREARRRSKEEERAYQERRKNEAAEATLAAEQALAALDGLLRFTLDFDDRVDFDALKDRSTFPEARPPKPAEKPHPSPPQEVERIYTPPPVSFFGSIGEFFSPAARKRRLAKEAAEAAALVAEDAGQTAEQRAQWQEKCAKIDRKNAKAAADFELELQSFREREAEFKRAQAATNARVDESRAQYEARDPSAIEQYCDMVLSASKYPDCMPQTFRVQYREPTRMLVVEYVLPSVDALPRTKSVKYVAARDSLVEATIGEKDQRRMYDSVVYQVAIRTLHELFEADVAQALDAVVFNGIVETIDSATGQSVRPCIVSVQATKEEFVQINLAAVDPKACFKRLRGFGSAQLAALAPVAPIVQLATEDPRYVQGHDVMSTLDGGTNLATIDWEEFEHLVRELFEHEFASTGAQVKVTRASRDGGVDAVILDPDPIRGGKFVIQAKRYNNVVPVSAVRDLYGTMINEGAAKGILVTTATFGPDSYTFAKDKTITLIEGANLLYLLQKHGTRAHIDLKAPVPQTNTTPSPGC